MLSSIGEQINSSKTLNTEKYVGAFFPFCPHVIKINIYEALIEYQALLRALSILMQWLILITHHCAHFTDDETEAMRDKYLAWDSPASTWYSQDLETGTLIPEMILSHTTQ